MEPLRKCRCKTCKDPWKPISAFSKDKYTPDGLNYKCRICCKEAWSKYSYDKLGARPMSENKECSQYLGIVVAGFARKVVSARKVTNTIIALVISNYRQFDLT